MFEYLQSGRPILGVGFGADTEVGRVLLETGVGAVCGVDQDRIGHHLRTLRSGGALDGFAPNPVALAKYRRDRQARRLIEAMATLLLHRYRDDEDRSQHHNEHRARQNTTASRARNSLKPTMP
jgi:hypothetical protein